MRLRMLGMNTISPAPKYGDQTCEISVATPKYLRAQIQYAR